MSILIVGAGPTGLMMACELARFGIDFKIIDKKPERTLTSNATWIQTRTIEIFEEIGIADRFLKSGHFCNAIRFYSRGKSLAKIPLDQLESLYQFVLMLPQSDTERILNGRLEELNHSVERPFELVDLKPSENGVKAILQNLETGERVTSTYDWVIGCDGVNSIVRDKCGMTFPGEDLQEQFMVADAEMDSFLNANEVHVFLDKGTLFSAFPLGANKYRLGANLHLNYPRKFYTEKEVKEIVIERAYGDFNVESVSWISPFWIHSKIVSAMRQGCVFLAGDSAHTHSPAGGQGMNSGIQDAYNLAWKLALVIKGKATTAILDSYQEERYPILENVVKGTEKFMKMAMLDNPLKIHLRNWLYKLKSLQPNSSRNDGMRLTQLALQYLNSSIIDYKTSAGFRAPKQGKRAPNVSLTQTTHLNDYLRDGKHQVLLFTGLNPNAFKVAEIIQLQQWLNEKYTELMTTHVISARKIKEVENGFILDSDNVIHARYHLNKSAIYIIRPDHYIAYCSSQLDQNAIANYLQKISA